MEDAALSTSAVVSDSALKTARITPHDKAEGTMSKASSKPRKCLCTSSICRHSGEKIMHEKIIKKLKYIRKIMTHAPQNANFL